MLRETVPVIVQRWRSRTFDGPFDVFALAPIVWGPIAILSVPFLSIWFATFLICVWGAHHAMKAAWRMRSIALSVAFAGYSLWLGWCLVFLWWASERPNKWTWDGYFF